MSRTVGYAIVGCGAISAQHRDAILASPGARLVAVQSRAEQSARTAGEQWNLPWYTDLEALLRRPDVDAAVICTPSGLHAEHALAALRAGKHAVIEKPVALRLCEADEIIAEGRKRNLLVSTISQRRFEPVLRTAETAIHSGALGRLALAEGTVRFYRGQEYYDSADWRGTVALDGGALMNQAIHTVDVIRWLMGPVSTVSGHIATLCHRMEAEDVATASVRFACGALGTLVATTCSHPGFAQELRIHGDKGYIHISGPDVIGWEVPGVPPPLVDAANKTGSGASDPRAIGFIGHARQYADVTAAILEGRQPAVTGQHGREALELVLAVYESSRTGKEVNLQGGFFA